MNDSVEENRNKRRDGKRDKLRFGMRVNVSARKLAEILQNKLRKEKKVE